MIFQLCGFKRTPDNVFGVITDTTEHLEPLSSLQRTVLSWAEGKCDEATGPSTQIDNISVWESSSASLQVLGSLTGRRLNLLNARGDCPTAKVASGDSCGALATKVCARSARSFLLREDN